MSSLIYECDQCGACCRYLVIEADPDDVLREPRIAMHGRLMNGRGELSLLESAWSLNVLQNKAHACVFLAEDSRCGIYATRPGCCVGLQAGSPQCQDARVSGGLEPLQPRDEQGLSVVQRLAEDVRRFQEEDCVSEDGANQPDHSDDTRSY